METLLNKYKYLRPDELAEWLGVTEVYIYYLVKHNVLHFNVIKGKNYVRTEEIEQWIIK